MRFETNGSESTYSLIDDMPHSKAIAMRVDGKAIVSLTAANGIDSHRADIAIPDHDLRQVAERLLEMANQLDHEAACRAYVADGLDCGTSNCPICHPVEELTAPPEIIYIE